MITIIIAVILFLYVFKNYNRLEEFAIGGGVAVAGTLIICAILVPMAGFTEPSEEVIELMPLRLEQATDKVYYIEDKKSYCYYAYDNSKEYGLGGGAYQEDSVYKDSSVKVYESEDCIIPVLKVFKSKSKVSWYSLAGMWDEIEYVFYIPVGTKYVTE